MDQAVLPQSCKHIFKHWHPLRLKQHLLKTTSILTPSFFILPTPRSCPVSNRKTHRNKNTKTCLHARRVCSRSHGKGTKSFANSKAEEPQRTEGEPERSGFLTALDRLIKLVKSLGPQIWMNPNPYHHGIYIYIYRQYHPQGLDDVYNKHILLGRSRNTQKWTALDHDPNWM